MTLIKVALKPIIVDNDIDYLKISYINVDSIKKNNNIEYVIIDNDTINLLEYFVQNDINVTIGIIINKKNDFNAKKLRVYVDKLRRKKQQMFLINSTLIF